MRRWKPHREPLWRKLPDGGFHPFGLRARKAEVLHHVGKWTELENLCREDLALTQADADRGFLLLQLGMLSSQRGDRDGAGPLLDEALRHYLAAGHDKGADQCRQRIVNLQAVTGRFAEAQEAARQLLAEAEARRDRAAACRYHNVIGITLLKQGDQEGARAHFTRKLELARELGSPVDELSALDNIGLSLMDQRRQGEALAFFEQVIAISRRIGDLYSEYYGVYNLASACEQLGRAKEALRLYLADLDMARRLGDGPGERDILDDIERARESMKEARG